MNLPNSITFVRILSIPLLIWVLSTVRIGNAHGEKELLASALFIAASITDGIDGYLARKRGQITTMGILLDPLADKMLIASAYITLVQFNPSLVPAWVASNSTSSRESWLPSGKSSLRQVCTMRRPG